MKQTRTRLTVWMHPKEEIESEFGFVTNLQWAQFEILRILRLGIKAEIGENGKRIAIFKL